MVHLHRLLPALVLVSSPMVSGCSGGAGEPKLDLHLQPVAFGGEHERVLELGLGELQAYRLHYAGPLTKCFVVAEVFENGKLVATNSLFGMESVPDTEMLFGLIALEPRRDGDASELIYTLSTSPSAGSTGGSTLHGSAVIGDWDALARPGEIVGSRGFLESHSFAVRDGEPVVLWRWGRGGHLPPEIPLNGAPPSDMHGMLQVTIRFE